MNDVVAVLVTCRSAPTQTFTCWVSDDLFAAVSTHALLSYVAHVPERMSAPDLVTSYGNETGFVPSPQSAVPSRFEPVPVMLS